jgi:hypothetical protein
LGENLKGKFCGGISKSSQVQNKPNLDNIFKSYLGYHDLEGLHNLLYYLKRLYGRVYLE